MSPGITVVRRQPITTSARAAWVRAPAPSAAIRPSWASTLSISARGDASTPVASAPMLTSPSVGTRRSARRPRPRSVLAETTVDRRLRALPVVSAEHPRIHDGLGGRVEHLVLELAAAELRAHEVPHQLEQLHAVAGGGGGPAHEALDVGPRLGAGEARLRGRQLLEGTAGQLAQRPQH